MVAPSPRPNPNLDFFKQSSLTDVFCAKVEKRNFTYLLMKPSSPCLRSSMNSSSNIPGKTKKV